MSQFSWELNPLPGGLFALLVVVFDAHGFDAVVVSLLSQRQQLRKHFDVRLMMNRVASAVPLQPLLDPVPRYHWSWQHVHSQHDRFH
jgi:hypothetical protein